MGKGKKIGHVINIDRGLVCRRFYSRQHTKIIFSPAMGREGLGFTRLLQATAQLAVDLVKVLKRKKSLLDNQE